MDIQRLLLIAAGAVLSVMLLVEWTAFKEGKTASIERSRLVTDTQVTGIDSPLTSVDAGEQSTIEDDLPAVVEPTALTPNSETVETQSTNRYIQVKTNTLEIVIDLMGGDIVEAALPEFPDRIDTPDMPFVMLEDNSTRTYIAQSGLVGPDGIDTKQRATYTATSSNFIMTGGQPLEVKLEYIDTERAVIVEKRYTFYPDSYVIDLAYELQNNGNDPWQVVPFAQLKRDSSQAPAADQSGFGLQPFLGAATTTPEDRFKKFSFDDIADDPWKANIQGGWIGIIQHYFVTAWIPNQDTNHNYSTRQTRSGFNIAGFTSPAIAVAPHSSGNYSARLYIGPKDQYALAQLAPHLELTVDYGWLWWIAQPLFWLLTKIQSFVSNWGIAIILLTVLVKGAFFKLSAASYRSMAKMRAVQPKMQAIREQYAEDKQKQSQAMMELYKKEKINPMGGCLPVLIQMPVFIALYWVLMESVELRQAPFALWIKDLAVMDPYFVLPILMGASMFFMQKLNPPPPDPMQAKIMQWLPVVFTFFFLWFPAGLVLYWVCNNLLSMTQQFVITRNIEREAALRK